MTNIEKYRKACLQHIHWPIFAQAFWMDLVCDKWDVFYYKTANAEFYLPYSIEKKGVFTFIRNPHATPYTSIYCSQLKVNETEYQQAIESLQKYFSAFSFVQLDQHFLLPSIANNAAIPTTTYHTNIVDTSISVDQLKTNCKSSLLRHLKFADKQVSIEPCSNATIMHQLLQSTAKHRKIKNVYSLPFIKQLIQTCSEHHCGIAWIAKDTEGNVHACLLQVWDNQASYSILAASLYPESLRGAMAALLWHAILTTKEKNIPYFDFEGSRVKGIDTFFKTFGTLQKDVYQINMQNSKLAKWLLEIKKQMTT